MRDQIPQSKLKRSLVGGKAAAKVGGGVLKYMARRPFLSQKSRKEARRRLDEKSAQAIFNCLTLLKGTALKVAQLLSMELELFPPAVRRELQKSYNQVPPLNRVLTRKAVQNALGQPPERVFAGFDLTAFAAASLGQVHRAQTPEADKLAVKIQYPGIQRTIKNDLQLLRGLLRPLKEYEIILPAIHEIEQRLLEETDYAQEARNMIFFAHNLNLKGVAIPAPWEPGCSDTILSATYMEGLPLNHWLKTNPSQTERDQVAQCLNDIFLRGLYELHCIHADPNPGNFIIAEDLTLGLVDFGCMKQFDDEFVSQYRKLPGIIVRGDKEEYFEILRALKFTSSGLDKEAEDDLFKAAYRFGQWLGKAYQSERYDFSQSQDFAEVGKVHMQAMYKHRGKIEVNPQIVFLNRTRFGLIRLFEQMKARVNVRNPYEWDA
ncbi:MAG: AarF/UbiB family protein [Desulfarculaceae bacterium]|jgi:predicted unusual protein kinase regulating ubiquinone biosynthesis (AarF/ABC1/UbiB family)